ncbi:MAG TPA: hypothetical protein VGL37_09880 [Solirubrobacteraceae bacterium]|jgi:hypothetical protein
MAAGEFAEYEGYAKRYEKVVKEDQEYWPHAPGAWGLHDYKDLSKADAQEPHYASSLEHFLKSLKTNGFSKPRIWISEAGVELKKTTTQTRH